MTAATSLHQTSASVGDTEKRDGVDARQRGWFWHWNGIVTQYAPLIGLKGVGLLNSYTVWTDRREESPHRGYAFPSQQAEADFYGEDRAELITINKILVALGLIEIRKEMILRTDAQGRRWRVPHNLYRVRDRPEGVSLRAADVVRVTELAMSDEAVFRHVRRIFSGRFKPIDRDNVWHDILNELADHPLWQELQERTREIEERASARTRAGHRRRASRNEDNALAVETAEHTGPDRSFIDGEHISPQDTPVSTTVASSNSGQTPGHSVVELSNEGSRAGVGGSNDGFDLLAPTSAAQSHNGQSRSVGRSNTTYDQETLTTRTTTSEQMHAGVEKDDSTHSVRSTTPVSHSVRRATDATIDVSADPVRGGNCEGADDGNQVREGSVVGREAGSDDKNQTSDGNALRVVDVREAQTQRNANRSGWEHEREHDEPVAKLPAVDDDREEPSHGADIPRPTLDDRPNRSPTSGDDGQRRLDRADFSAGPSGGGRPSGPLVDPDPLVVSVFEAANNRRSSPLERILLGELERDADPAARAAGTTGAEWLAAAMREAVASGSAFVAPKRIREIVNRWAGDGDGPGPERPASRITAPTTTPRTATAVKPVTRKAKDGGEPSSDDHAVAVRLPGGTRAATVWPGVLDEIARILDPDAFDRLLADSVITRYWRGTVEIRVASEAAVGKLSAEYRGIVERHLSARLKRPVAVSFHAPVDGSAVTSADDAFEPVVEAEDSASYSTGIIVVAPADVELGRQLWHAILDDLTSDTGADDLERLASVVPLGQDSAGAMVLGVSSPVARRLLEGRYRNRIEQSLSGLVGGTVAIRAIADDAWNVRG